MLALFALGVSVSSALASTTIEVEVEVTVGNLRSMIHPYICTRVSYQLSFRVQPFVVPSCKWVFFQQFLSLNGFTSVSIIENGASFPASSFGSKILKQISASKKIFFRYISLQNVYHVTLLCCHLIFFRATTLQRFSADGIFFSYDGLIFLLNQADDLGR